MQPNDQDRTDTSGPEPQDISAGPQATPDDSSPTIPQPRRTDFPTDEDLANPQAPQTTPPDYLGLTPVEVTPPPKSKSKKGLIIGVVLFALLAIITASIVGVYVWAQGSPERQLYATLENAMQSPYITQKYTGTSVNPNATIEYSVESDLSDPAAAQSQLEYKFESDIGSSDLNIQGKQVVLPDGSFLSQVTKMSPESLLSEQFKLNQWAKLPSDNLGFYDVAGFHLLNSPFGILMFGQFSPSLRGELMSYIKSNNIYTVESTAVETISGTKTTVFNIKLDTSALNKLYEKAGAALNIKLPFDAKVHFGTIKKLQLWVDNSTNKVVKSYLENIRKGDKVVSKNTIIYSYLSSIDITQPSADITPEISKETQ